MGSSVTLIFLIPALIMHFLSGGTLGELLNPPKEYTEIALPYDKQKAIVWEYDNVNDDFIELVEVKTENGQQIFVFDQSDNTSASNRLSNSVLDFFKIVFTGKATAKPVGEVMDLVFTDDNGNKKIYYAYCLGAQPPKIYPAEECLTAGYAITPAEAKDGAVWDILENTDNILYTGKRTTQNSNSFTVVAFPDDIRAGYVIVKFGYQHKLDYAECYFVDFEVINGALAATDKTLTEYD